MANMTEAEWVSPQDVAPEKYVCGYCGAHTGPNKGYLWHQRSRGNPRILLCTNCNRPSFWEDGELTPGAAHGSPIQHLPPLLAGLYEEARSCFSVNAFSPLVLACRKMLMHVAVELGADKGKQFAHYVQFLIDEHHVPKRAEEWVKYIKNRGNEENHEIVVADKADAEKVLGFTAMLLKMNYEFPENLSMDEPADEEPFQVQ